MANINLNHRTNFGRAQVLRVVQYSRNKKNDCEKNWLFFNNYYTYCSLSRCEGPAYILWVQSTDHSVRSWWMTGYVTSVLNVSY